MALMKLTCLLIGVMSFFGSIHGASFSPDDYNFQLENRTKDRKDLTGLYHGEHHHAHVHSPDGGVGDVSGNAVQVTTVGVHHEEGVGILQGPPTANVAEIAPHCLCVVRGTGCKGREAYTKQFEGISTLVCGLSYERCCFEDPWPGVVDAWASKAPCVPQEVCPRWYGQAATDVRDFGVMGPCPGAGAVRCLHGLVENNEDIGLVAIVPPPPPVVPVAVVPEIQPPPPVETIVVPIVPQPTPTAPPRVVTTPAAEIVTPPAEIITPPAPTFAAVPEYEAPTPVVTPVTTYQPPVPVTTYQPPVPVTTYQPPVSVTTYQPPVTNTYEPPVPVTNTYLPPVPVTTPLAPAYTPGPPYLWRNLGLATPYYGLGYNGYGGFGFGWPYKYFQIRKRFGFGYGF